MKRRKRVKKTKRKGAAREIPLSTGKAMLRRSSKWPLLECIISAGWRETNQIIQLCVVRQSPQGDVIAGVCVIDLGCLGVKNAYAAPFQSVSEYRRELRSHLTKHQKLIPCDLNLAAKVIVEAVQYAGSLGFRPNRDLKNVLLVMGDTHPETCAEEVPLGGEDGRPLFIAGPYDDPARIMRVLDRKVGPGNYHFIAPMDDPAFFEEDVEGMTAEIDDEYE